MTVKNHFRLDTALGPFIAVYNSGAPPPRTRGETAQFEFHFPFNGPLTVQEHSDLVVSGSQTIAAGTSVQHSTVTVESGATLTVDGSLETAEITVNGTLNGSGAVDVIDYYETTISTPQVVERLNVGAGNRLLVDGTVIQTTEVDNNGELVLKNGAATRITDAPVGDLLQLDKFAGKYETVETSSSKIPFRQFIPPDTAGDSLVVGIRPAPSLRDQDVEGVWGLIETVEDARGQPLSIPRIRVNVTILAARSEYDDAATVEAELEV